MDNLAGLRQTDVDFIISTLKKHPEVVEAYLFGSRAKGNFRLGSDVDIALKGEKLNQEIISEISYQLNEELPLPYKFDILNYLNISNKDLVRHIDRVGIRFYLKSEN